MSDSGVSLNGVAHITPREGAALAAAHFLEARAGPRRSTPRKHLVRGRLTAGLTKVILMITPRITERTRLLVPWQKGPPSLSASHGTQAITPFAWLHRAFLALVAPRASLLLTRGRLARTDKKIFFGASSTKSF